LVLYARQWCSTPEDVVQDVFVLLMGEAAAPENPLGWLYRAVRNKAINAGRSGRRRSHHEARAAHRGEPWLVVSDADRLDAAAAACALAELPIEQREVIVARLWGGLSLAEIAALTGSSISTAHRWYQQGIAALRERLEGTCPEKKSNCRS
jgi:RNA polymerase sigma-70 factor (ECF subfamily)